MIDEREGMSIIYVVFMTTVMVALVILFGLRSRYAQIQSTGDKPDIVGLRGGAARFASPRLFDQ